VNEEALAQWGTDAPETNKQGKGKAVPLQAWSDPEFQEVNVPRFHDNVTGW